MAREGSDDVQSLDFASPPNFEKRSMTKTYKKRKNKVFFKKTHWCHKKNRNERWTVELARQQELRRETQKIESIVFEDTLHYEKARKSLIAKGRYVDIRLRKYVKRLPHGVEEPELAEKAGDVGGDELELREANARADGHYNFRKRKRQVFTNYTPEGTQDEESSPESEGPEQSVGAPEAENDEREEARPLGASRPAAASQWAPVGGVNSLVP